MAEVRINPDADDTGDVEMQAGDDDVVEIGETGAADPANGGGGGEPSAEAEASTSARVTFVEWVCAPTWKGAILRGYSYLRSPIVELVIGPSDSPTVLFAHQGLLTRSPWFEQNITAGSVGHSSIQSS